MRLAADLRAAVLQAAMQGDLCERTNTDAHELLFQIKCDKQSSSIRKDKRLFPDDTEPDKKYYYVIPSNWVWTKIGVILSKLTDGTHKTPKYVSKGLRNAIKFVSVKDMSSGHLDLTNTKYISQEEHEDLYKRCDPKPNDVLLSKVGTTGVPAIVDTDEQFSLFVSVALMRFDTTKILPKFLYWLIYSPIIQQQAVDNTRGVGNQNWVLDKIANTWIPIPPVEEQALIVERIDEIMPVVNEYEEMENRLVALKEAFPGNLSDAVLQAAVMGQLTEQDLGEDSSRLVEEIQKTKKQLLSDKIISRDNSCKTQPIDQSDDLPEIPSNWTWVRLGSLCSKIGAGSTPAGGSKVYVKSGIKFLREQNIHNSGLMMDGLVFITDEINASMKGSQVQAKDILVNITGASIGRNALVPDDFDIANVNQHVLIVRLIDDRLRHYIHLCLQSPHIFNQMMDKQMGDKPGLSATKVANFLIPLPPIEEQQRIVDRLYAILPMCDGLAEVI